MCCGFLHIMYRVTLCDYASPRELSASSKVIAIIAASHEESIAPSRLYQLVGDKIVRDTGPRQGTIIVEWEGIAHLLAPSIIHNRPHLTPFSKQTNFPLGIPTLPPPDHMTYCSSSLPRTDDRTKRSLMRPWSHRRGRSTCPCHLRRRAASSPSGGGRDRACA